MTIDIAGTLDRGGNDMVQLLSYCVFSRRFDPVFLLLVKNYQMMPRSVKALALFDEFVAQNAPLSLSIGDSADHLLVQTIGKIRILDSAHSGGDGNRDVGAFAPYLPAKFLFDGIIRRIASDSAQSNLLAREYDPAKTAVQNLPEGKLSGMQLQYLERVWKPARQRLVAAGFRTVTNIGG